jgi:hypothetical protein
LSTSTVKSPQELDKEKEAEKKKTDKIPNPEDAKDKRIKELEGLNKELEDEVNKVKTSYNKLCKLCDDNAFSLVSMSNTLQSRAINLQTLLRLNSREGIEMRKKAREQGKQVNLEGINPEAVIDE